MPIDPRAPFALDPHQAQAHKHADLSRRVSALERNGSRVSVGAGAPSSDGVADGVLYVDLTNVRLYVRVNGTWRYTALT